MDTRQQQVIDKQMKRRGYEIAGGAAISSTSAALGPQAESAGNDMSHNAVPLRLSPAHDIEKRLRDCQAELVHLRAALRFLGNPTPSGHQIAEGLASLRFLGYHY